MHLPRIGIFIDLLKFRGIYSKQDLNKAVLCLIIKAF